MRIRRRILRPVKPCNFTPKFSVASIWVNHALQQALLTNLTRDLDFDSDKTPDSDYCDHWMSVVCHPSSCIVNFSVNVQAAKDLGRLHRCAGFSELRLFLKVLKKIS